jgi:hypothetical protein
MMAARNTRAVLSSIKGLIPFLEVGHMKFGVLRFSERLPDHSSGISIL